jgi:glycosyltransferase involved in cell wall biosynthesis
MLQLTVAICTYNGANRLTGVLEKLRQQSHRDNLSWEILVVDNNSKDETASVVTKHQLTWPQSSKLRYIFEPRQGLAFARQRAVEEANSPLIGFLDDDNWPDANWVEAAYNFAQKHPEVGAYGSRVIALLEKNPPFEFKKISTFLAAQDRGTDSFIYYPEKRILPPGAGLVVRRQTWLSAVPRELFLIGRVGETMLASEDLEALTYIQQAGWEIWHNPQMVIQHQIPSYRLEASYLSTLIRGIALARHHIRMIRLPRWKRPLFTLVYLIYDLKNLVIYGYQRLLRREDNTDFPFKGDFLSSSLQSPLYLGWKRYIHRSY